ncbi:site-specific integrase [Devosia sp.]|uniref:site-specific integrase n=1 Tax=Devosia sp. TaxID=1871048 RepID=UPI001AC23237|nr:site-specific integrase [Devosia sp.]MBN9309664.1 site-specific integrase [Devosia sp.]
MTVRKLKNSWWVDFRFDHVRHRKRSPENSKAGAQAYEIQLRRRLALGEPLTTGERAAEMAQTFEAFAWQWFEDYVVPNNKPWERLAKTHILRSSLVPFFGRMRIVDISKRDIEQYKAWTARQGVSNKTINNRLAVLRKCLGTAYEWLGLKGTPPAATWLKNAPLTTSYLTEEEAARLLAHADGIVREMIMLALRTGMRQGELKGLQWSSINWETRILTVQHSKSDLSDDLETPKSNRLRFIPMHRDVQDLLFARRRPSGYVFLDANGRPFDRQVLRRRLLDVCDRAGLRPIGWHALRHTFASHLAMRGVPLGAVQELLGHSTITMTMRYAHIAPSTLHTAIETLTAARPLWATGGQPVA